MGRRRVGVVLALAAGWLVSGAAAAGAAIPWTQRIPEADGLYALSGNGRFVAFESSVDFLPGDDNGQTDVVRYDRLTGRTELASVDVLGHTGTGESADPAISDDGSVVVFGSSSALAPGGVPGSFDAYAHDFDTGQTIRLNLRPNGAAEPDGVGNLALSGDGRVAAYTSRGFHVPAPAFLRTQVYVRDIPRGVTDIASVSSDGTPGNRKTRPSLVALSGTGRFVAFDSTASNLVPGDTAKSDIFVRDRLTRTTELVNVATDGTRLPDAGLAGISDDGRYVVFDTVVARPGGGVEHLDEIRDRLDATTETVNSDHLPHLVNSAAISGDGRYVVLVRGLCHVSCPRASLMTIVVDRATGRRRLVLRADGRTPVHPTFAPQISDDGSTVAFLAPNDGVASGGPDGLSLFVQSTSPPAGAECTVRGTPGNDVLAGTDGDDVICAGAGDDTVAGSPGFDVVFAGPGDDTVGGGSGEDTYFGGPGDDRLRGRDDRDQLVGGPGSDVLEGGPADDILHGRDGLGGNDTLDGGPGEDDRCPADANDALAGCP